MRNPRASDRECEVCHDKLMPTRMGGADQATGDEREEAMAGLRAAPRTLVTYAVCMAATVYLSVWAAIALVGPNGLVRPTSKLPSIIAASAPAPPVVPSDPPAAVVPPSDPPAPPLVAGISGLPGDKSALVGQMQRALVKRGYRVGDANHFDADTVTALQAFQNEKALTVQPTCNQQCWDALGLADPR